MAAKTMTDPKLYYQRGLESLDFRKSILYLTKALDLGLSTPECYYERGLAYWHLKRFKQALQDFNCVIKLLPGTETGYIWRGHCYLDMKRYALAISDYRRGLKINSEQAFGYPRLCLAKAYLKLHRYHLALGEYRAYMAQNNWLKSTRKRKIGDNHKIDIYASCLAPLYKAMGKNREARWAYERALKLAAENGPKARIIRQKILRQIPKSIQSHTPEWFCLAK